MMKSLLFLVFTVIVNGLSAQMDSTIYYNELKLEVLLNELRTATNNTEKVARNQKFKELLAETIELPGAMEYPFASLRTMGKISSPDNLVKLFTWNIEQDDFTQKYYCLILRYDEHKKEYQTSELVDNSGMMNNNPDDILDAEEWYGALYYQIIPFDKGSRTMYAVLGWDGYTTMTNRKLIDVLYFSGKNPKLGSPVFRVGKETFKRIFYEHSEKCTMSMKYDETNDRILFEHMSPESPSLKGFYAYYVPDMTYDAFREKNGKWYLDEDVIAVNKKTRDKINVQHPNAEGTEVKTTRIKNEWINPTDDRSPVQGIPHLARTPDDDLNDEQKKEKEKRLNEKSKGRLFNWKIKKDKRDPSQLYPYNSLKKGRKKKKRWRN
jgi:hypothetical protein